MSDLRISDLPQLTGVNLSGADVFAVADISASETKKITVTDAIGYGVTLIADATIPGAKILFNAASIPGSALQDGSVDGSQIASGAVTAGKLADESTVDLVTSLPAAGAYTGQLALDTDDLKVYCWDGSTWQSIKAAGSINFVSGSTTGTINIAVTTTGDSVAIAASLDNTSAANQFLAGPTNAAGEISYRTIDPTDLPTASTTAKGAVQVNGEGLRMDGAVIELDNDVAVGASHSVVTYNAKGLITGGRAIQGADLPIATAGGNGAVQPGSGLSVTGGGVLNHSNSVTGGTATKVTFDSEGHVTSGATLVDSDIPNLPASKITTGTLNIALLGTNAITGDKLANSSTVKFGGAGSTAGVVTFPSPDFQGQYFFDALNGDLYLHDGSAWQPITITSGELVYGGTYDASQNEVKTVTAAGSAAGLVVGAALPNASASNLRYYVVVSDSGTGTAPAPTVSLAPPDMLVSSGATWDLIDVSNAIAGQIASNISFTPYGNIAATNVQTALQELEDEKLPKAGGTMTGELLIGSSGALAFEGSSADAYETYLAVVNATADRTITLPDASGTVVLSGAIVNADIDSNAAIAFSKLASLPSGNILIGNSGNVATSVTVTGDVTISNSGVTGIAAGAVVDADISASAAIAHSKLANITAGSVLLGNGSNVPTATALSGDVTINSTGVTAIGSGVIVDADISASAEIAVSKLADGSARQLLQTDSAGTGVEWASNIDVPGSLDVTGIGTFDAATRGAISALSDAATITPDFAAANHFSVTLGGNRTLANPTNIVAGQSGCIWITQDGSGSRTLAYGSHWDFSGGTAPTLSTAANAVDCLVYAVQSSTKITATLITNLS